MFLLRSCFRIWEDASPDYSERFCLWEEWKKIAVVPTVLELGGAANSASRDVEVKLTGPTSTYLSYLSVQFCPSKNTVIDPSKALNPAEDPPSEDKGPFRATRSIHWAA